jgi:hypothetical protein
MARSLDDGVAIDLVRAALNVAAAAAFMVVVRGLTARHQRLVGEARR